MATVTSPVYTRVPDDVKQRITSYKAATKARSEAAAIAELLVAGLEAAELDQRVSSLTEQVDQLKERLAYEVAARTQIEQQHAALDNAVQTWMSRAKQRIAQCPACRQDVTGQDLMVSGTCSNCNGPLTLLLEKPASDGTQRDSILMLLAAAGLVLGLVAISRGAS
jgi:hypothetical protein